MQENTKSVVVKMTARRCFRTEPIWQYDVGHVLTFEGFELPMSFEVHFSRSPMGNAIPQIGTDGTCTVPDMYTQSAGVIYAWLYIADTDTGLTKYSIEIPVAKRAKPTNQEPTPVEQSAIDQAIAALNAGVERSETAADAAESAQEAAEGYAEAAGNSAITATNAANSAASAKTAAETAARNAATSATDAHTSREAADQSATNAGVSERAAASSATAAAGSATSAAASAGQASASATAASGSASTASTKAGEAAQSATAAAGSAASASEDAGTASTAATAAEASATAAAGSATAAAGSATSAGQSATAAAGSAQAAQEVLESIPEDYTDLSDDVDSLKSALTDLTQQSDADDVDLDITDANGNVIVRFAGGHIQTKEFDSSDIPVPTGGGNVEARIANYTADLVLSDAQGNVVAEFDDGHIRTKDFNSADVADGLEVVHEVSGDDYALTFAYDTTVSTKQTITGDFRQGDTILCHMSNAADDVTDESNTVLLTYGYVDANDMEHTLGQAYPYDFARFTLPEDATGINGNFGTGLLPAGTYTCKFLVYKLSQYARQPHIVTVGTDGRRMFTSVRAAMDSFSDNNAYNTYEIWVYPGTYNILADYTDDEISADGFVGLWVKNGVSIIGQGHREDIILHGELDPDDYNLTKRNAISTLNMSGNCCLKNLTVTNQYLRYAVHDDHGSGFRQEQTRIVENCRFRSVNAASGGIGQAAYGAGGHNNKKMFIRNCDLGDRFIIHNTPYMIYAPMTAVVENCIAQIVTLTDNNNTTYPWTMPTRVEFNNCNFDYVRHDRTENGSAPTMILTGVGSYDIKLDCEAGTLYNFGDCRIFPGTISAGQAVKMNNSVSIAATTSRVDIYGISIGNDGSHTWVQREGYIANTVLGLTELSVGDYITINASGVCVAGGTAENAIGIVECIDAQTSTAFIKLLF